MSPGQVSLFDAPAEASVRVSDPVTSVRAAGAVELGAIEQAILDEFAAAGARGLTDDELVGRLAARYRCAGTVKSARSRLSKPGKPSRPRPALLVESGLPPRPSVFGRDMTVWVLAPAS